MDISIEEMNLRTINMAYNIVEKVLDIDETIKLVRELYDNIKNDFFLLAKRRLEMIIFRLFALKYYTVEKRIGSIDRKLYCQQTDEGAAYRADVIRCFDQTFDREKATQYIKKGIEYQKEGNSKMEYQYFMKSALEGFTISAFHCGDMIMKGEGCQKDEFLGAFWFWQSVNMNNENAIACLGYCYYTGLGVWQGKVRAMYWFAIGTYNLQENCIKKLADMLIKGEVISGEEETGKALEVALEHLDKEENIVYIKQVGATVNTITAEWLQEKEGGV